ncbi:hypothetical protein PsYK624_128550 [Phanerochaete sordida]|uniref:Uncharacterized protein n=1 Tax=Phanerochaete sordida TaxID=48140 RepID=A0A9P3LJG6_9APHY|nr:hypothetical protein PsYK624_128550 [Phanerochaete sordida]
MRARHRLPGGMPPFPEPRLVPGERRFRESEFRVFSETTIFLTSDAFPADPAAATSPPVPISSALSAPSDAVPITSSPAPAPPQVTSTSSSSSASAVPQTSSPQSGPGSSSSAGSSATPTAASLSVTSTPSSSSFSSNLTPNARTLTITNAWTSVQPTTVSRVSTASAQGADVTTTISVPAAGPAAPAHVYIVVVAAGGPVVVVVLLVLWIRRRRRRSANVNDPAKRHSADGSYETDPANEDLAKLAAPSSDELPDLADADSASISTRHSRPASAGRAHTPSFVARALPTPPMTPPSKLPPLNGDTQTPHYDPSGLSPAPGDQEVGPEAQREEDGGVRLAGAGLRAQSLRPLPAPPPTATLPPAYAEYL